MPSGVSLAKMAKKRENFASQKREGKEEEAVAKRNYDLGKSRRRKHGEWRVAILSSCIFLRKFLRKRVRFPPFFHSFSAHMPHFPILEKQVLFSTFLLYAHPYPDDLGQRLSSAPIIPIWTDPRFPQRISHGTLNLDEI